MLSRLATLGLIAQACAAPWLVGCEGFRVLGDASPGDRPAPSDGALAGEGRRDAASLDRPFDRGEPSDRGGRLADARREGAGKPLDPLLSVPPASGKVCQTPGDFTNECPALQVCRFFSSKEGRCEGCSPCGNLHDSCSQSSECDILFTCYGGKCTSICPLGTYYCGPIEDCLDVGYPGYGVCRL